MRLRPHSFMFPWELRLFWNEQAKWPWGKCTVLWALWKRTLSIHFTFYFFYFYHYLKLNIFVEHIEEMLRFRVTMLSVGVFHTRLKGYKSGQKVVSWLSQEIWQRRVYCRCSADHSFTWCRLKTYQILGNMSKVSTFLNILKQLNSVSCSLDPYLPHK